MRRRVANVVVLATALVFGPLVVACSGNDEAAPPDTEVETTTTTTTAAPLPRSPLTGLPGTDAAVAGNHPAIVVKIDNGINSRPQTGLSRADIVFEEEVEGVTRLASVFHSQLPDVVGNVRSGRSSDVDIVGQLSRPLFAWSGGNPVVTAQILAAQRNGILTDASFDAATPAYYRSNDRKAPYNLYVHPSQLLELRAPADQGAPAPVFTYREDAAPLPAGTLPVPGVTIVFTPNAKISYAWDTERHGWDRFQIDSQHTLPTSAFLDADGGQVAPENVVVLYTPYGISAADKNSPQAFTVGEGEALVFTDGKVIGGRWVRPSATVPAQLLDGSGQPISLTPGRTWVELPRTSATVAVFDQATADGFLAVRG